MIKKLRLPIALFILLGVISAVIYGAYARISFKTDPVKNPFTVGNIKIELTETEWVVPNGTDPGDIINKNPQITVDPDSNPSWVYIMIGIPVAKTVDMTSEDWSGSYELANETLTIPITAYGVQDKLYGLTDAQSIWDRFAADSGWQFPSTANVRDSSFVYLETVQTKFIQNNDSSAVSSKWSLVAHNYTNSNQYDYYVYSYGLVQPGETTEELFNKCLVSDIFGNHRQNYIYFKNDEAVIDAIQFVFEDINTTEIEIPDYGVEGISGWKCGDTVYEPGDTVLIKTIIGKDSYSNPVRDDIYFTAVKETNND